MYKEEQYDLNREILTVSVHKTFVPMHCPEHISVYVACVYVCIRPAGRCLQLVRPIRREGGSERGLFIITCTDPVHGKNSITYIGVYVLGLF